MFCKNCGNSLPDSASFCNNCGSPVSGIPSNANNTPQQNPIDDTVAYDPISAPSYQPPHTPAGGTPGNKPQPKKQKSKNGLIIAIGAVVAVLVICVAIAVTVLLGTGVSPTGGKEVSTTESETQEIKPELINDPISYFIQQPDSYYKLTTDSNADYYIYPEYGSTDHYPTRFAGNELIFVYGTYNGWACFEYEDSANGYAWCKTASIYKTDEVPTQPEPETVYVPTPNPAPSYSPVYVDSYYRVQGTGSAGLNLRESPSTSAYVYVVLQESELVYVHQTNGTWAYVSTVDHRTGNSYSGWCATQYLSYAY